MQIAATKSFQINRVEKAPLKSLKKMLRDVPLTMLLEITPVLILLNGKITPYMVNLQ